MREPTIVTPFSPEVFADIQRHAREVRRLFDWPGIPYHDHDQPDGNKFNRWCWHNLPVLRSLHSEPRIIAMVSDHCGKPMRPSYVFLSMYGDNGVCPKHSDRPQCEATIDLLVNQYGGEPWPIMIKDKTDTMFDDEASLFTPYTLKEGDAVMYSGTGQPHYRDPMHKTKSGPCDLAFFHFVDIKYQGPLS